MEIQFYLRLNSLMTCCLPYILTRYQSRVVTACQTAFVYLDDIHIIFEMKDMMASFSNQSFPLITVIRGHLPFNRWIFNEAHEFWYFSLLRGAEYLKKISKKWHHIPTNCVWFQVEYKFRLNCKTNQFSTCTRDETHN